MIESEKLVKSIESKIIELGEEYQKAPAIILTESDLKYMIYKKLSDISEISEITPTEDEWILGNSIHTEVSWYDTNRKLTIRPDITIIDTSHLSILHITGKKFNLPSKQFSFKGKSIIFEIKFIRGQKGITENVFDRKIKEDYEKIRNLFEILSSRGITEDDFFGFFVIFNKTNLVCEEFSEFLQQNSMGNNIKIIYISGNVDFSKWHEIKKEYQ